MDLLRIEAPLPSHRASSDSHSLLSVVGLKNCFPVFVDVSGSFLLSRHLLEESGLIGALLAQRKLIVLAENLVLPVSTTFFELAPSGGQ